MPSIRTGWKAAALTRPLFVLVLVLLPVVAVHGMGGALTHGHPDSMSESDSSAAGGHAAGEDSAHGIHSFTVTAQQKSHHNDAAAAGAEAAPTESAASHAHADCLSVASSAGLFPLLLWPLLLASGARAPTPPPPRAASVLRLRGRVARFRRTLLRLAELSVLQV